MPALLGLDSCVRRLPPLDPRAVVDARVGIAEEVLQCEPRLARPIADRAVGDHGLVPCNAAFSSTRPSSSRLFGLPSAVRSESIGTLMEPGTRPARPPSSVAPDGQKRSPRYSLSARTSRRIADGSPIAASNASRDASRGGCSVRGGWSPSGGPGRRRYTRAPPEPIGHASRSESAHRRGRGPSAARSQAVRRTRV